MAVTIGTNSGFVSASPTEDPAGSNSNMTGNQVVTGDTSPSGATTIYEVGYWQDNATADENYRIGLFADSSGVAGALLQQTDLVAKGSEAGWKKVTVNWSISGSTAYWIGFAIVGSNNINWDGGVAGPGWDRINPSSTTFPDPFGGGTLLVSPGCLAIYALWVSPSSAATTPPPNLLLLGVG